MSMLVMMIVMLLPLLGIELFVWLPLRTALPLYLVGLVASAVLHRAMLRASKLPVTTGREGMIGRSARVMNWGARWGWVQCGSENWLAVVREGPPPDSGSEVTVAEVDGLMLVVEPSGEHRDATRQAPVPAS